MATVVERALGLLGLSKPRDEDEQAWLKAAADMGSDRLDGYDRADDYYRGEHRVQLIDREREFLEASGVPFSENYCETIVDAMVDRLRMTGFKSEHEGLADFARGFWRENRLKAGQVPVHEAAVKLGDAFVILEPGESGKLPRAYYNTPRHVKVVYDSGEALHAVKVWATRRVSVSNPEGRPTLRMNIYWPDEVEKWFTVAQGGDWAPFVGLPGDDPRVGWTMDGSPSGEPIGIPVVHIAHKPRPHYGVSKLHGTFPQQDAFNKSVIDFFWVMDSQGWPQQWGKGVGDEKQLTRHPGSLWTVESTEAEFGQFPAADPTKSITALESQVKRMASRSQTALHLMLAGGNLPSGETLKTSESGQVKAIERFHVDNGNRWEDVAMLAARIETAFGEGDLPVDEPLEAQWKSAESRSEIDDANTAVLWQTLGVSEDTVLSRLGFDPAEERRKRDRDGEGAAAAQELLARARQMQAPTRSEELGGGRQPAQDPENRRTQQ